MSLIIPANSASAAGGYAVDNSCRFNGTAAYLNRTQGTSTNLTKFAWSGWIKRSKLAADQVVTMNYASASNYGYFYFRGTDDIRIFDRGAGGDTVAISDMLFRDISAWYHIALIIDTTQATNTNRLKLYVNGILQGLNGVTYPAENASLGWKVANTSNTFLMRANSADSYVGGYLAEVAYVDGTANAITDFGEFDEDSGIWKPIDVSGLTFGNEGYYLDFQDSANLGNDANGGTDFTSNNISSINQSLDTPTNNYCTLNPLFRNQTRTNQTNYSIGNTKGAGIGDAMAEGSMLVYGGKWYYEATTLGDTMFGWGQAGKWPGDAPGQSFTDTGSGVGLHSNGRILYKAAYITGASESFNSGTNTVMIAIDFDNQKFYHGKNGNWAHSMNPAGNSGGEGLDSTFWDGVRHGWVPAFRISNGASDYSQVNFGNPLKSISSGNADDNSHGNFEYDVPAGFYALNTKNLAEHGG